MKDASAVLKSMEFTALKHSGLATGWRFGLDVSHLRDRDIFVYSVMEECSSCGNTQIRSVSRESALEHLAWQPDRLACHGHHSYAAVGALRQPAPPRSGGR